MPCRIKIKDSLYNDIQELATEGMGASPKKAKSVAAAVNKLYREKVLSFGYVGTTDLLEAQIIISENLITDYYDNEVILELNEATSFAEEVEIKRMDVLAQDLDMRRMELGGKTYDYTNRELYNEKVFQYWNIMNNDASSIDNFKANEIAKALGDKFKAAFGINYDQVSTEEAVALLANTPTPYNNQPAFFYNNVVYFVDGQMTVANVLHEFAHPFINAISISDRKLFDNLYTQLTLTKNGETVINQVKAGYPNLKFDESDPYGQNQSDRFKEEVLVTALEYKATHKVNELTKTDEGFKKFIKNLLYAIKQIIRKLTTKKVVLGKLNENTTLEELANMMVSEDFIVENLNLKPKDFAEFKEVVKLEWQKLYETLNFDKDKLKLEEALNRAYSENMAEIARLRNTPWKLREELASSSSILTNIKEYLKDYETVGKTNEEKMALAMELQQKEFKERSIALVNSLTQTKVFSSQIENIVKTMKTKKSYLTQAGISKVIYYQEFLNRQALLLSDIKDAMDLETENPFTQKIISIEGIVSNAQKITNNLMLDFTTEFFTEHTEYMSEAVEQYAEERIKSILKNDGYTQDQIDNAVKAILENENAVLTPKGMGLPNTPKSFRYLKDVAQEFYSKRLNRNTIKDFIEGRRGDIGLFTSMITPYMSMNDPITGSFARFIKSNLSETEGRSYNQANDIASDILPFLKQLGYNPNNTRQLSDMLLFTDTVPIQKEDGSFDTFEVYTFLNRFGNGWRSDQGKLKYDLEKARIDGDKDAERTALEAIWKFEEDYMHREFKKEFYEVRKIWRTANQVEHPVTGKLFTVSQTDSQDAFIERQTALRTMNNYKNVNMADIEDHVNTEYLAAEKEYNELFSYYTEDGVVKDTETLGKVLVRLKYKEESAKFMEFNTNEKKVQRDFEIYVNTKIGGAGITMEDNAEAFQEAVQKFTDRNFIIGYSDEYYEETGKIYTELNKIAERNKTNSPIAAELANLFKQRRALVTLSRDTDRRPNGQKLSPNQIRILHQIELDINKLKGEFDSKTGLSAADMDILESYETRIKEKTNPLTEAEKKEYINLVNVQNTLGMSKEDVTRQRQLYKELSQLRDMMATEYYVDSFNFAKRFVEFSSDEIDQINQENAGDWINNPLLIDQALADPTFKEWFDVNHYQMMLWDQVQKKKVPTWVRTSVWTLTLPSEEKFFKKTTLINPIDGKPIEVRGVPNKKYTFSKVKDKYYTIPPGSDKNDYVGTILDNRFQPLPRKYEPGNPNSAVDAKYINKEYENLEARNDAEGVAQFKLLTSITDNFLKLQVNKPNRSKLYLDFPRFRQRSTLELVQSGKTKESFATKFDNLKSVIKSMVQKDAADYEQNNEGHNFDANQQLEPTDMRGNPIDKVPVRGLYKLKKGDTSTDVLASLYNYLYSLNEQETLMELEPIAKSITKTLNENKNTVIKDMNKISSNMSKAANKVVNINLAENKRAGAVDYLVNKVFYGQGNTQFQVDNPMAVKVTNLLMGNASRAFIALDLTSAMKNRYGMMFQSIVEGVGGKYYNLKSLASGRIWSAKAVAQLIATGVYSRGPKSLELQLMEHFDPITGKTRKDFGKSSSRTFMKDFFDATWMYDFRRLTDLEAGLQVFGAMMHDKYVTQVMPNGETRSVKYINAWKLNENQQLTLLEGIDPEWSYQKINHTYIEGDTWELISERYAVPVEELKKKNKIALEDLDYGDEIIISSAKKFQDFKFKIQGIGKKLNGQMDNLVDDAQANKYLGYRLFTFYKRFAVPMFLNRFQYSSTGKGFWSDVTTTGEHTYDWDMGDLSKGYWISALQAMKKVVWDAEKYYPLMTPEEKTAVRKVFAEGVFIALLSYATYFLFGYDSGDEDRFAKMRERQDKYGMFGYMGNHILYQLIAVRTENEAFIPIPGLGLGDWLEFTNNTTIAFGPTLGNYAKIIGDLLLMLSGDEKAIYSQDAGPYEWQKEGRYKIWNHFGATIGLKGKNYSPIKAIKSIETFENSKLQ